MDLQLFSIEHAPRAVPAWELILEDLGKPAPDRIARALGIGRSTVYRWSQHDQAPRVACLALFWLTRWGHSLIHAQATNNALLSAQLARSLDTERTRLQHRLQQLCAAPSQAAQMDLAVSTTGITWPALEAGEPALPALPPDAIGSTANSAASDLLELRQAQPYPAACGLPYPPGHRLSPTSARDPARQAPALSVPAACDVRRPGERAATTEHLQASPPAGPGAACSVRPTRLPPPVGVLSGAAAPAPASPGLRFEPGRRAFSALVQATTQPPQRSKR